MSMLAMLMFAMLILGQRVPKPPKSIGFQNGGVDYHYSIDLLKLRLDYISRMLACKHYVVSAPAIRTYKLQSTVLMLSIMHH